MTPRRYEPAIFASTSQGPRPLTTVIHLTRPTDPFSALCGLEVEGCGPLHPGDRGCQKCLAAARREMTATERAAYDRLAQASA